MSFSPHQIEPEKRQNLSINRAFSLKIYLLVVFAISWPFQFAYLWLGEAFRPILLGSMLAAGFGTYICGRYIFRDGFHNAGWHRGKPGHYLGVVALALFLWGFPVVLEWGLGMRTFQQRIDINVRLATLGLTFFITLLPAFGEEFSWRGYLLPRLDKRFGYRKALLIQGLVTWVWHLPFLVGMGLALEGNPMVSVLAVLLISLIPAVMHAVVFAWIWQYSGSLAVVTVYHAAFDEIRDTLEGAVGFGVLSANWQAVVLTILGIMILIKNGTTDRNRASVKSS